MGGARGVTRARPIFLLTPGTVHRRGPVLIDTSDIRHKWRSDTIGMMGLWEIIFNILKISQFSEQSFNEVIRKSLAEY